MFLKHVFLGAAVALATVLAGCLPVSEEPIFSEDSGIDLGPGPFTLQFVRRGNDVKGLAWADGAEIILEKTSDSTYAATLTRNGKVEDESPKFSVSFHTPLDTKSWLIAQVIAPDDPTDGVGYAFFYRDGQSLAALDAVPEQISQWQPKTEQEERIRDHIEAMPKERTDSFKASSERDVVYLMIASSFLDPETRMMLRLVPGTGSPDRNLEDPASDWDLINDEDRISGDVRRYARLSPRETDPPSGLLLQFECSRGDLIAWISIKGIMLDRIYPEDDMHATIVGIRINDTESGNLVWMIGRRGDQAHTPTALQGTAIDLTNGIMGIDAKGSWDADGLLDVMLRVDELLVRVRDRGGRDYYGDFRPRDDDGGVRDHLPCA